MDLRYIDKKTGLITVSGHLEAATIKMTMKRDVKEGVTQKAEREYQVKIGDRGEWYEL